LDHDWRGIATAAKRFNTARALFDYTLPLVSFFSSRKVTHMAFSTLGDVCIEDLWRPFYCVSTNLTRAQPVIHRQGPLWRSVRASLAMPGVFSPVVDGGDLLVDGGLMNNVPLDIMRDL